MVFVAVSFRTSIKKVYLLHPHPSGAAAVGVLVERAVADTAAAGRLGPPDYELGPLLGPQLGPLLGLHQFHIFGVDDDAVSFAAVFGRPGFLLKFAVYDDLVSFLGVLG